MASLWSDVYSSYRVSLWSDVYKSYMVSFWSDVYNSYMVILWSMYTAVIWWDCGVMYTTMVRLWS